MLKPWPPTTLRVPITWKGTCWTATTWPIGLWLPKSFWAVVAPRTATWAWAETSASVKKVPLVTVRLFATSQPGVEPETAAVQFCAPATIGAIRCTTGATAMTSGATEWSSRASASLTVRVLAAPRPARTPPAPVVLPGTTVIRLVPSAVIRPVTYCRAPRPMPTVRMTAATPMRIPSAVSSERNRCPLTERKPVATVWKKLIRCGSVDGGGGARAGDTGVRGSRRATDET